MDLFILTTTKDRSQAAITSASDTAALEGPDDFPQLVLGTTEPLRVYHLSAASTYESWSADPAYTITAALGLMSATGLDEYASATLSTVIANGKSGNLDLSDVRLSNALRLAFSCRPRATALILTLQLTVTDAAGAPRIFAQLPVQVNAAV